MSKKDKYFKVAESVAATSSYPRIKIGAVIVKRNNIISVGVNATKSHPLQKKHNIHRGIDVEINHNIHAEMAALVRSKDEDLVGADIFIFRKNVNGDNAMCKPCKACEDALYKRGIRNVYYTTDRGFAQETYN